MRVAIGEVAVRRLLSFLATVAVALLVAILPSTPAAAEPARPGPPDPGAPTLASELAALPTAGTAYDQRNQNRVAPAVFWQAWSGPASYRAISMPLLRIIVGSGKSVIVVSN